MLLLDTHALVWLDQDDASLGKRGRRAADRALVRGELVVSAISFWEVAMLSAKGRLQMDIPVGAWRRDLLEAGLVEVPVDGEIGIAASELDALHADPADRMIVATVRLRGGMLLTADERLLAWGGKLRRQDARV
jgi:PIN domain nuclease of toxin-antitoxin system